MPTEDEIVKAQYHLERASLDCLRQEVPVCDPSAYATPGRAAPAEDTEPASGRAQQLLLFERAALGKPWHYVGCRDVCGPHRPSVLPGGGAASLRKRFTAIAPLQQVQMAMHVELQLLEHGGRPRGWPDILRALLAIDSVLPDASPLLLTKEQLQRLLQKLEST